MSRGSNIWWTIIGIIVIGAIAFFIIVGNPNGGGLTQGTEYRSTAYGFSFNVPDGYEVNETSPEAGEQYIMLMPENYMPPENGEGPPLISINVIPAASAQDVAAWVRVNTVSNFALATTPLAETSVDGTKAVSYSHDGLYPTRVVALLHNNHAILISGSYHDMSDKVYGDFEKVVSSFELEGQ